MKLQSTYKGQSAGQILKTAKIETMQAGNVEITVTVDGRDARAHLGTRTDGWGSTHSDVLVIDSVDGLVARLLCGPRAVTKLGGLTAYVDRRQRYGAAQLAENQRLANAGTPRQRTHKL